jgi:hypothetical protein
MNAHPDRAWIWLCSAVVAHLLVSMVHGTTHTFAHVPLSPAANLFVILVILAGPVVGLGLSWPARRGGSWLVAITMAASLIFGIVNHFVRSSPDHVAHVDPAWRLLFATTAVLLAVLEVLASGLAVHIARERTPS